MEDIINKDIELEEDTMPMEDYFQTTVDDYDEFDNYTWNRGEGYKLPNFKGIEDNLEGLVEGLYLFAGESNTGKTALMSNMMYDACTCPDNHLFGIYYSLDDSKFEIIPRIIAMDQRIPISAAAKPKRYQNIIDNGGEGASICAEYLRKRQQGLDKLKKLNNAFKIEDAEKITCAEDLYKHMVNLQIYVRSEDPKANIIVGIDSINDIRFKNRYFSSTADKHAEIAKTVKGWVKELHIPIFTPIHLRKLNANRRPVLDDLKESGEYVYEANMVWLLHNDVGKNKESAKIYYHTEGIKNKQPIIEVDWAKNKLSSFKGRNFCFFSPEYSKAVECNKEQSDNFDALIYEL